jgi:hypothetical protein
MTLAKSTRDSLSISGCFMMTTGNMDLMLMQGKTSSKIKQKSDLIELDQ